MADAGRALLKTKSGEVRRFLSFKSDASGGVNISPARGVPGLVHESGPHYAIEVPGVPGIHMSVHGSGQVHIRANQGGTVYDQTKFPPLRDLAAPTYVLEIHPAEIVSYPLLDKVRDGDQEIDIGAIQENGFVAAIAVSGPREEGDPHRAAYPSLEKASGPVEMRHSRHIIGSLEFQVALLSATGKKMAYNENDEWWRLMHPKEPGDALPRPWGGTMHPPQWELPAGDRPQTDGK